MGGIHKIINKYVSDDFVYPPIQLNKKLLSMQISMFIMRTVQDDRNIKCHQLLALLQEDMVNYLSLLSSIKIFNDAKYIIEPLPINHRIKNQQGVFVFSNNLTEDIISCNELSESNIIKSTDTDPSVESMGAGIFRIDILKEYIPEIYRELNLYGISKEFIYPELPSYAEVMQKRVILEIKKESYNNFLNTFLFSGTCFYCSNKMVE